ncbi:hypothetical protein Vqi01_03820 [Micromonospora qiuiae]|uniref:Uncharacterized protein n=1 Tax=Micromonospora qiuiae TaxID=502268 RepID=A0ABQ4J5D0_9ACTN|nr:hypothetical protein Vqi01_03820 [Micromonospora qiuiae]
MVSATLFAESTTATVSKLPAVGKVKAKVRAVEVLAARLATGVDGPLGANGFCRHCTTNPGAAQVPVFRTVTVKVAGWPWTG